jgi:hypothetical protein
MDWDGAQAMFMAVISLTAGTILKPLTTRSSPVATTAKRTVALGTGTALTASLGGNIWFSDRTRALIARDKQRCWGRGNR